MLGYKLDTAKASEYLELIKNPSETYIRIFRI